MFKFISGIIISSCLLFFSCKKEEEEPEPTALLSIEITNPYHTAPDTISFKGTSSLPLPLQWNFNDGTALVDGEQVTHVFTIYKYFDITLCAFRDGKLAGKATAYVNTMLKTRISINEISVTGIPLTDSTGLSWDSGNNAPDPYCEIIYNGIKYRTGYNTDSFSLINFPLTPTPNITHFEDSFKVSVVDYDPGSTTDKVIASSSFSFFDIVNTAPVTYPTVITKTIGAVTITFHVFWS